MPTRLSHIFQLFRFSCKKVCLVYMPKRPRSQFEWDPGSEAKPRAGRPLSAVHSSTHSPNFPNNNSIGCLWNSAANTRSPLLTSPNVTLMLQFPLTFQLLSACIRLHTTSDHRTKNSWKSLNAISNLLVTVLSVSLPQLSGIHCLPACGISPPSLT